MAEVASTNGNHTVEENGKETIQVKTVEQVIADSKEVKSDTANGESETRVVPETETSEKPDACETKEAPGTNGEASESAKQSNGEGSTSKSEDEKPSGSKTEGIPPKRLEVVTQAANYLAHGRRHILVSDFTSAVAALMEACRLLAEEFGDLADECAEAYYYYGLALLENARHEGDVLGDAVEGGEKTEDDDEEDESEEEEKSGDDEEMESEENGEAASAGEEPKEKTETTDEKPITNGKGKALKPPQPVQSAGEKTPEAEEVKDGNEAPEEEVEEASNDLQLAWEILELAKQIYERQAQKDPGANPRLADSLLRLAEVAIESENYTSAIEDLQKCLGIQTASLPADSRSLAETHYQLGVAYTFTTDFAEAIKSFEAAAAIIQQRLDNLEDPELRKTSVEDPKPHAFYTVEGEIEELNSLLPDIREKIADTIDLEKEAARKMKENGQEKEGEPSTSSGFQEPAGSSSSASSAPATNGDSSKPAMDITHLIRKKRKPEEAGDEATATAAKKVCSDENAVAQS